MVITMKRFCGALLFVLVVAGCADTEVVKAAGAVGRAGGAGAADGGASGAGGDARQGAGGSGGEAIEWPRLSDVKQWEGRDPTSRSYLFDVRFEAHDSNVSVVLEDSIRLDLRGEGSSLEAMFTPSRHGGSVSSLEVTQTENRVLLRPGFLLFHDWREPGVSANANLETVELMLGPSGVERARLKGMASGWYGDAGSFGAVIDVQVPVFADNEPPSFSSPLGPDELTKRPFMPWDKINVRSSEGVDPGGFRAALSVETGAPGGLLRLPCEWALEAGSIDVSMGEVPWGGYQTAQTELAHWGNVSGRLLRVSVAPGLLDLAGNVSTGDRFETQVHDVPGPLAEHDFEGELARAGTWGNARIVSPGDTDADVCESGRCLLLGPYVKTCKLETSGAALRLEASPGQTLHVRSKIDTSRGVSWWHRYVSMDVVAGPPEEGPLFDSTRKLDDDLYDGANPKNGVDLTTGWQTHSWKILRVHDGELGVMFVIGGACWPPNTNDPTVTVAIERVWVE